MFESLQNAAFHFGILVWRTGHKLCAWQSKMARHRTHSIDLPAELALVRPQFPVVRSARRLSADPRRFLRPGDSSFNRHQKTPFIGEAMRTSGQCGAVAFLPGYEALTIVCRSPPLLRTVQTQISVDI
jgi:hypothetical protein